MCPSLAAREWAATIAEHKPESQQHFVLVGNKVDLLTKRRISQEEGQQAASELGVPYLETSALKGMGVTEPFWTTAALVVGGLQEEDVAQGSIPLLPHHCALLFSEFAEGPSAWPNSTQCENSHGRLTCALAGAVGLVEGDQLPARKWNCC